MRVDNEVSVLRENVRIQSFCAPLSIKFRSQRTHISCTFSSIQNFGWLLWYCRPQWFIRIRNRFLKQQQVTLRKSEQYARSHLVCGWGRWRLNWAIETLLRCCGIFWGWCRQITRCKVNCRAEKVEELKIHCWC